MVGDGGVMQNSLTLGEVMEKQQIEEIIVMLRQQKVAKFSLGEMHIEFTAAAFYEEVAITQEEKDEDEDEILYHSV